MSRRISKEKFLFDLAVALSSCKAHSKVYNRNHDFVVEMAYVLYAVTQRDGVIRLNQALHDDLIRLIKNL